MKYGKNLLISVVGPTASGKTHFAIRLAMQLETEIISADSRQFYRELEIGTAKPDPHELAQVTHHFINSHSIHEQYSAGQFGLDARRLLHRLFAKYGTVVVVGGSGLFLKALWEGMDQMPEVTPEIRYALNEELRHKGREHLLQELEEKDPVYFHQVDQMNPQRIVRALEVIRSTGHTFSSFRAGTSKPPEDYDLLKLGLETDRQELYHRIDARMDQMIEGGLFEEAERLIRFRHHNALQTVGYSEIFDYLDGVYDREEAIRLLKRNSRRYAKRQLTWFRKDPEIKWISPEEVPRAMELITNRLNA